MWEKIIQYWAPRQSVGSTVSTSEAEVLQSLVPPAQPSACLEESAITKQAALSHGYVILRSGPYLAYPRSLRDSPIRSTVFSPVTIIARDEAIIDGPWLAAELSRLQDADDVFSEEFLSNIIFCCRSPGVAEQDQQLDHTALQILEEMGTMNYEFAGIKSWISAPYFSRNGIFYEAWKLYPDNAEAFYFSTVPDPDDPNHFLPLTISAFDSVRTIAVPSRHYFPQDKEKPLNGLRVAIKDIYDLKGVRTAASNRSFRDLYHPRQKSANAIQRLIDDGAIIVGKTKTTAFADRELATQDWIDTHSPFNPRGDGYIWGGGSSTGSAAAVAAYDWLDFAIGTDTSGSARGPAANHGIYGFRPTFSATAMDGVVPSSILFDTPAFFTRNIVSAEHIAKTWYHLKCVGDKPETTSWKPCKILWPSEYCDRKSRYVVTHNEEVHLNFEHFVSELEAYLGVQRSIVSLRDLWNKKESHKPERNFDEYFKYTYEAILNRDSYTNNVEFVKDHERVFGCHPYLPPSIMNRWKHGKSVTEDEREHAAKQVSSFKHWFEEDVLGHDSNTNSSAVMVWPWTVGSPNYLDLQRPQPNSDYGYGFQPAYTSSFTGAPEFVFPIGTWAYDSRVSGRQERLPVAASLMCASGLDSELMTLAHRFLENSDLPKSVETGREMLGPDPAKKDLSPNPPIYDFNRPDSIEIAGRSRSRALDCTDCTTT